MKREYHIYLVLTLIACIVLLVYSTPLGAVEGNGTMLVGRERLTEQYGSIALLSYNDIAGEYSPEVLEGATAGVGLVFREPVRGTATACILVEYNSSYTAQMGLSTMEYEYLHKYESVSSHSSMFPLTYGECIAVRDPATRRAALIIYTRLQSIVMVIVVN